MVCLFAYKGKQTDSLPTAGLKKNKRDHNEFKLLHTKKKKKH